jgi:hypothetical protein
MFPTLGVISPASATAGSGAFTLTVTGTQFVVASFVRFNGNSQVTTFVSATQLTAQIPAANIAAASTVSVVVVNPAPCRPLDGGNDRADDRRDRLQQPGN